MATPGLWPQEVSAPPPPELYLVPIPLRQPTTLPDESGDQRELRSFSEHPRPIPSPSKAPQADEAAREQRKGGPLQVDRLTVTLDTLMNLYSVRDPVTVQRFLSLHRPLLELLFAAFPRIHAIFGGGVETDLRLVEDPDDESETLVAYVVSERADAYEALREFDENWWLDHIMLAEGFMNFTLGTE